MIRYILAIILFLLPTLAKAADSTVTTMTAASALGGTELLYVVQGAADRKGTPLQIAAYNYGLMSGDATASGTGSLTLATVNANVGTFGNATNCITTTQNAKGLTTAISAATCTPAIGNVTGLGTGVATALGNNLSAAGGVASTIASGTSAMGTGAISSATCATVVTTTATNTATTDVVMASFNSDPTAVTGYVPLTTGMLTIIAYPTSGNVNFKVCNNTSSSITPGAITLNWRVLR